ncbi:MAG TPA: hypothetical protein VI336_00380 [Candidatus Saccharimonadales bacterium]|nr:hypothetical protein [Candidatus Saccharimonadales bacterium]
MFIVLEGSDGSGKTTQFKLLTERLRAAGHDVDVYDFPRYSEPSSYFVKRYLNGDYGPASEVSPYTASLFYALDRFEAAPLIRQSLADGKIVLANRYTGSNMAHQGAKFTKAGEQRGFFVWADSLEFQLLGVPRPSLSIFLRVPAEVAYELIKKKASRTYTAKVHDEHEADLDHLKQSVSAYDTLCQLFPKDFRAIECAKNNTIMPVTDINNLIWEVLKPMLPAPKHAGHSTVISLSDKEPLPEESKLPNTAQTEEATISKDEVAEIKDISLLAVSNLLGNGLRVEYELNWPPSTSRPRLNYFIPTELPPKLAKKYESTMDTLIANYRKISKTLPGSTRKYAAYAVPLAALVDANVSGNVEAISQVLSGSSAAPFGELRQITRRTRAELREPQALKQIIKRIADTNLGANSADFDHGVKLIAASPKNELDLLADCLYQYSNMTRGEIAAQIDTWSYEQKATALKAVSSSNPGSVLNKVNYRFDVLDSLINLENLVRNLKPSEIQAQPPTPRYGYQVPEAVEAAGIDELFIECFDLSLELYSDLQAAGLDESAGYAVLTGHRQRWQFAATGEPILRHRTDSAAVKLLREQIAHTHPLISSSITEIGFEKPKNDKKIQSSSRKSTSRTSSKKRRTKSKK